jgi:hypothetical protein
VEVFFVSRSSAVERIMLARRVLLKEIEGAAGAFALGQGPSLLDKLEQLLFDVRAGRVTDFVMPSLNSKVRILVMHD